MTDNHLSDEFFANLAGKMPAMKRQIAEKHKEELAKPRIKQHPCLICARNFGSKAKEFSLTPGAPKPFCPSCQSRLDSGMTLFLCDESRKYLFVQFPEELGKLPLKNLRNKINVVKADEYAYIETEQHEEIGRILVRLLIEQGARKN